MRCGIGTASEARLMRTHAPCLAVLAAIAASASGCTSLAENLPMVHEKLRTVSAGYTGCMPEENILSNIKPNPDGSGTWNATCKGKTYLCSAIATVDNSVSFHCAPAAQ